jgi:hypothetical protein
MDILLILRPYTALIFVAQKPNDELRFIQKKPIIIVENNNGSIMMVKNPQFHK